MSTCAVMANLERLYRASAQLDNHFYYQANLD